MNPTHESPSCYHFIHITLLLVALALVTSELRQWRGRYRELESRYSVEQALLCCLRSDCDGSCSGTTDMETFNTTCECS